MTSTADNLYARLPAIYRIRDAEQGFMLRALLRVIGEQADILEEDISRLYDNWFIETCDDWVVPYIGDLLGYLPLHNTGEPLRMGSARDRDRTRILIPRRDVANTIRYRRRKGTLALLELLADDVADWPARAVEFYRLLGWTQPLNHPHLLRGRTTDIRDGNRLECIDGPFDSIAHSVDIRRIGSRRGAGRYNIPDVGVFVCRLKSYPVTKTPAFHVDAPGPQKIAIPSNYTFSVLGNDTPLFTLPVRETDPRHIAEEINLPVQVRRRALEEGGERNKDTGYSRASGAYYGPEKSMAIWVTDWPPAKGTVKGTLTMVPADQIIPADLSEWKYTVPKNHVAVDPLLGRIKFPASQKNPANVFVRYHYGFSADIGGGEYSRPIPGPDLRAVSRIQRTDIRNTDQFGARLAAADSTSDPVSAYIQEHLSPDTKGQLKVPASPILEGLLVRDLDTLLADEAFYDPGRFKNTEMSSPELTDLLSPVTDGDRILRRNRLLLEAAYPDTIATSYRMYRVGEHENHKKINDALTRWQEDRPVYAVIEITDSGVYVEPIEISLEPGQSLYLRAADTRRPVIRQLNWETSGPDSVSISGGGGSRVVLDGLLVTGRGVRITGPDAAVEKAGAGEDLCEVVFRHCTLVPGWSIDSESCPEHGNEPSIELMNTRSQVRIEKSIIGSILVSADTVRTEPNRIRIRDSILDATGSDMDAISAPDGLIAHAALSFERCTVIGKVSVHTIRLAGDSIFTGRVTVVRSQVGCMRFCYVPNGSRTPRRFRCLPDSLTAEPGLSDDEKENIRRRINPYFTGTLYGTPGYCQLGTGCAEEIRRGAEDESEMGVFHDLYQTQRETNLHLRLDEYTPTGMEPGIIFVN
jgi:hypothetical protein